MEITSLPIRTLSALMARQDLSAEELCASCYRVVSDREPIVRAFITLEDHVTVLRAARAIDASRAKGMACSPLLGLPIAVKDNIAVSGLRLTCGSKILEEFVSPYDATVIARLRAAGMLFIGKTNMDEFGMGSSTENSAFFPTTNPHNSMYVPGGTSGGSAAAVAALEVPIALGSDTGGSVRQPAAFCGVVGLKPSYGRISRYGLVAYASSLDQIGILARDVLDAAFLLPFIAGIDPLDSTSRPERVEDYFSAATEVRRFRVGIPREYMENGIDDSTRLSLENCIRLLETEGCKVEEISLPHTEAALPTYYLIASCEASANLARYEGIKYGYRTTHLYSSIEDLMVRSRSEGFGQEVQRRILLGTFALSYGYREVYYVKARRTRFLVSQDFKQAFEQVDVLLHPVSPTTAWLIGEKVDDPLHMYLSDILSVPASLAGVPALVLPAGKTTDGLPIGLQVTGPLLGEATVLAFSYLLERLLART